MQGFLDFHEGDLERLALSQRLKDGDKHHGGDLVTRFPVREGVNGVTLELAVIRLIMLTFQTALNIQERLNLQRQTKHPGFQ